MRSGEFRAEPSDSRFLFRKPDSDRKGDAKEAASKPEPPPEIVLEVDPDEVVFGDDEDEGDASGSDRDQGDDDGVSASSQPLDKAAAARVPLPSLDQLEAARVASSVPDERHGDAEPAATAADSKKNASGSASTAASGSASAAVVRAPLPSAAARSAGLGLPSSSARMKDVPVARLEIKSGAAAAAGAGSSSSAAPALSSATAAATAAATIGSTSSDVSAVVAEDAVTEIGVEDSEELGAEPLVLQGDGKRLPAALVQDRAADEGKARSALLGLGAAIRRDLPGFAPIAPRAEQAKGDAASELSADAVLATLELPADTAELELDD